MEYKVLGGILFAAFLALIFYLIRKDTAGDADVKVSDKPKDVPGKESQ